MYLRLVGDTKECYNYLEPLYNDYRKLKRKNRNGRECEATPFPSFASQGEKGEG